MLEDIERKQSEICEAPNLPYSRQAEPQEKQKYTVGVSGKSGEPSVPPAHGKDLLITLKSTMKRTYLAEESLLSCIGGSHLQEMIN